MHFVSLHESPTENRLRYPLLNTIQVQEYFFDGLEKKDFRFWSFLRPLVGRHHSISSLIVSLKSNCYDVSPYYSYRSGLRHSVYASEIHVLGNPPSNPQVYQYIGGMHSMLSSKVSGPIDRNKRYSFIFGRSFDTDLRIWWIAAPQTLTRFFWIVLVIIFQTI